MRVRFLFGCRAGMVSRAVLAAPGVVRWWAWRRLVIQAGSPCWPEGLLSVQARLGSRGFALLGRRRRRPFLSLAATVTAPQG